MNKALVVYLLVFLAACGKEYRKDTVAAPSAAPGRTLKVIASGLKQSVVLVRATPLDGLEAIRLLQIDQDGEYEFRDEMAPGEPYTVSLFSKAAQESCELFNAGGIFPKGPVSLKCK